MSRSITKFQRLEVLATGKWTISDFKLGIGHVSAFLQRLEGLRSIVLLYFEFDSSLGTRSGAICHDTLAAVMRMPYFIV